MAAFTIGTLGALGAGALASSIIGGVLQGQGDSGASDTQAEALQAALDLQREIFEENKANFAPFIEGGTNAFNRLGGLLAGDTSSFQVSPGFQFRQQQGEQGVLRNLAAMGLTGSGRGLKDVTRFNQGLASDEFGNFFNRNLALAQMGQTSAANQAGIGQNFANASGNLLGLQGQANAQGDMALSNAFNTTAQNALNSALLLSNVFGGGGGRSGGGGINVLGGGSLFSRP